MPIATVIVVVVTGVIVLLERIPRLRRLRLALLRPNVLTDVGFLLVGYVAGTAAALAGIHAAARGLRAAGIPGVGGAVPLWLEALVALVLLDLGNYAAHWLLHRSPALWRLHQVHHSSPRLDWLATFRSHLLEQVLRRVMAPLLLVALGVSVPAVALASAALLGWAVFGHANLRVNLRFAEWLMITPRLHHLHHVPATSSSNLGTVFSIWDRLRGRLDTREVAGDASLVSPPGYPQTFFALLRAPFTASGAR